MQFKDKQFLKDNYGLTDKEVNSVFRMVRSGYFTVEQSVKRILAKRYSK